MNINEILYIDDSSLISKDFILQNHKNAKKFGITNGKYNCYKNILKINDDDIFMYYLIDTITMEIAMVTTMKPKKINNKHMLQVDLINGFETRTEKRMAMRLYQIVRQAENIPIISGEYQTDDGKKLWKNLDASFTVSVINKNTGDEVSTDINDAYLNWGQNNRTTKVSDTNILMLETIENNVGWKLPGFAVFD